MEDRAADRGKGREKKRNKEKEKERERYKVKQLCAAKNGSTFINQRKRELNNGIKKIM